MSARQSKGRRTASPKDTPKPEIEIEPGAWERFKSAVHMMARPKAAQPFKRKAKQDSGKAGKAKKKAAKPPCQ